MEISLLLYNVAFFPRRRLELPVHGFLGKSAIKSYFGSDYQRKKYRNVWCDLVNLYKNQKSGPSLSSRFMNNHEIHLSRQKSNYSTLTISNYIEKNSLAEQADFILFGSQSSCDGVEEFSDVDILVSVNDYVLKDANILEKFIKHCTEINGLLTKIDPLQNHGIFFVTPLDLKNYDQTKMVPVVVLEKGTLLCKDAKTIQFKIQMHKNRNFIESLKNFLELCKTEEKNYKNDFRSFRDLLHRIYLLPCYVHALEYQNNIDKKTIMSNLEKIIASEFFKNTKKFYNKKYYNTRSYRNWIPEILYRKLMPEINLILNIYYGRLAPLPIKIKKYQSIRHQWIDVIEKIEKKYDI